MCASRARPFNFLLANSATDEKAENVYGGSRAHAASLFPCSPNGHRKRINLGTCTAVRRALPPYARTDTQHSRVRYMLSRTLADTAPLSSRRSGILHLGALTSPERTWIMPGILLLETSAKLSRFTSAHAGSDIDVQLPILFACSTCAS